MPVSKTRTGPLRELLRQIERLESLPLRPASARFLLSDASDSTGKPRGKTTLDLDPGWGLIESRVQPFNPLAAIAETPWWSATSSEQTSKLWRHSVAVSLATHRLAREANDPDPNRPTRAGLLHGLGLWIMAVVDPERLGRRLQIVDPEQVRRFEVAELGIEWSQIGRDAAERWGCDPLVADAAWLHGDLDRGTEQATSDPSRLAMIQTAFALAEQTPWALAPTGLNLRDRLSSDPKVKLLIAEVQARCSSAFVDSDATPREERLTRSNARLQIQVDALTAAQAVRDQLLDSLATSDLKEGPEAWAERVGLAWCQTPGVSAARVDWAGTLSEPGAPKRPPKIELPLTDHTLGDLKIRLWTDPETDGPCVIPVEILPAWRAWAGLIADRARLDNRLTKVLAVLRSRSESEKTRLRIAKLNALAEFAGGAGHELNNPLAVIVGRAQLLLVGETDPKAIRGIRAILTQAQRAHRILRDLMYVARTPEPRPRFCQPDEIVKASLRDASVEAEERGVKLNFESAGPGPKAWADPDGLRHVADSLLRNALEATPRGGVIQVCAEGDVKGLRWTWHDSGEGITPARGMHLFDPFYCGRAAGRGLGMGLPRVSRFVEAVGGRIDWRSTPGEGSTFEVEIPLEEPPKSPTLDASEPRASVPRT